MTHVIDHALIRLLAVLPKSALSRAVGAATRATAPALAHRMAVRAFAQGFGVNVDEAEWPLDEYATFGEFFTRRLRSGARPVAAGERVVASPVDARVAAVGFAEAGKLVQAKGCEYSLAALLNDPLDGRTFEGGAYVTLYLSPRDYHRVHAPLEGEIEGYSYVPGDLFPVNAIGVRCVPGLFCTNERLVTFLKTAAGRVAVVKVGALCVGRIRAAYDDVVTNTGRGGTRCRYDRPVQVKKGEEIGVFELGSTVILLFEKAKAALAPWLAEGVKVRMGEAIGRMEGQP